MRKKQVFPGESIQSQIDAASAGDIIAIFAGTYSEDITINKAVRLVEVSGQDVTLAGAITFTGVTDAPTIYLRSSGKDIVITGLVIREIDHTAGDQLVVNGTSDATRIVDSALQHFDPDAGVVELVSSTVAGRIEQNGGSLHTSDVTVSSNFETGLAPSAPSPSVRQ